LPCVKHRDGRTTAKINQMIQSSMLRPSYYSLNGAGVREVPSSTVCRYSDARRGLPSRDFGSGEARRRPGSPRAAGPRRASRRCAVGREYGSATPTTSRRSPGRRAPQRSRAKAAGRSRPRTHERDGNPRRLAMRDLRAPLTPLRRRRRSASAAGTRGRHVETSQRQPIGVEAPAENASASIVSSRGAARPLAFRGRLLCG